MTSVLAIAGSARRRGNSDALLAAACDVFRERGAQVETIVPRRLQLTPCSSCGGCWETGRCVVQDDMQEIYPRLEGADHIVVASPVYFTALPGHLKLLVDRCQCYWVRTFRLKDPPQPRRSGMFLCAGVQDRQSFFQGCLTTVKSWLTCLNVSCDVSRFFPGLEGRDAVRTQRPGYLEEARAAARELLDASA
jgi:multimeric flavodoxin WrbA